MFGIKNARRSAGQHELAVGVAEPVGSDLYWRDFSTLLSLNQHSGNGLSGRSPGYDGTAITVELDRGSLDDVGVLPEACVSGVQSNRRAAMCRHGPGGNV